jgi:alkanesulfonate monooxygenase SsuD/methylene tetrahydromethanopterin reductase-like flavin-dependent oxidoreductase (luciferase family)
VPERFAGRVRQIEDLGFDGSWFAEAYGSDVFRPLAWCAALTSRIRLGTAIAQIPARTPAAPATTATTLDHLSDGRVVPGLGASGPRCPKAGTAWPIPGR